MVITEETFPISCNGGLDTTTNTQELLQKPGWATRLVNFEPSNEGGYRRIAGYTQMGAGRTPGTELTSIKGVTWVDSKAVIVCHESSVYFSYNLIDFIKINVMMAVVEVGMDYTELLAATALDRPNSGHYTFEIFHQGTELIVMGACKGHNPFQFRVEGTTLEDSTYHYKEVTITEGSLSGASQTAKFKDQYVISGMDSAPAEIYYSDILKPDDFEGGNAGSIGFNDVVVGLQMFREVLYVFCKDSIHRVEGLSSGSPSRLTVTSRLGCVSGDSIRELAGDLVFLSPDGLRTLSATQNIGDVNLGTLSSNVSSKLRNITRNIEQYDIRTAVLRNKVQYRIFFRAKPSATVGNYSLIMHMDNTSGNLVPEFAEISGFDITAIFNGLYNGEERTISGDSTGNIWFHDEGEDFDGTNITFFYETPFFAINDPGYRKNIHKLITYIKLEGDANFNIALRYDYEATAAYQPAPYTSGFLKAPAVYGLAKYASTNYGSEKAPVIETLTEGSGKTMAIRIYPSGEPCAPFSLQGFDVYFVQAGRI